MKKTWWAGILPGILMMGLVVVARLTGSLQGLEWLALDYGLRLRPPESPDERIVIVGITEADIQRIGAYPIPDQEVAKLLKTLQGYQPRAIGLDIFRDLPVDPGHRQLTAALAQMPNVMAIEKALPDQSGLVVNPPSNVPDTQVGFVDAILDRDGFLRRSLLGTSNPTGEYRFSLTIRLAEAYLKGEGLSLENGIQDPVAMRFDSVELTRFQPNTGGYVQADAGGNQILINFRRGTDPFRMVTMSEVEAGRVDPSWFRDRIVLIGITALSQKDVVNSAAIAGSPPGLIYGVEVQAHAISQILSAVLEDRPLLTAWPDVWEYLWVVAWGLLGWGLGRLIQSPTKQVLSVAGLSLGLIGIAYGGLIGGIWIPLVPALLVFGLNGGVLYGFSVYDRSLRERIEDRQRVIEHTFDTIHNGPLQTLAGILRHAQDQDWSVSQFNSRLQQLNVELRHVYEAVRQETLDQGNQFLVMGDRLLDLQAPLHEVLYEVYAYTIQRDFPGFESLKVKVVDFEWLDCRGLGWEQKRDLCRFLEEALCNVGKYAVEATRLTVVCKGEGDRNVLQITDNGAEREGDSRANSSKQSHHRGTQQATNLARYLGGEFKRVPATPKGITCELQWPTRKMLSWPPRRNN